MVSFLVVLDHPAPGHFPDLTEILEQPSVQHFISIGSVETRDVGVLVGLSGFNEVDEDTVGRTSFGELNAEKR